MQNSQDKIKVNSTVVVKQSSPIRDVKFKATANLTEEEILKRNTIGTVRATGTDSEGASSTTKGS